MTDTTIENGEVTRYLAAIRTALEDLPAEDRDELLEELEAHLHEVLAEGEGGLAAILGSPAEYAAELRASAGLAPAPVGDLPLLRRMERALSASELWGLGERLSRRPFARGSISYVATLRPAWWLLRGWLAVLAVVIVNYGHYSRFRQRLLLVPGYFGTQFLAVAFTASACLASVWLGLRSRRLSLGSRLVICVVNVGLVLCGLLLGRGFLRSGTDYGPAPVGYATPAGLVLDGRQVQNIFPYDAQGHLLANVRLYDDRGHPITGLAESDEDGNPIVRSYPTDSTGRVVTNAYPQATSIQSAGADPVSSAGAASGAASVAPTVQASAGPGPGVVVPPLTTPTPSADTRPRATPKPSADPQPGAGAGRSAAAVAATAHSQHAASGAPKGTAKPRPARSR